MLLPSVDVTRLDGIPVTTPARTLIDLAGALARDVVEEALDDALRRKLVTRARLRWRLDALATRGRPGIAALRSMLDARDEGGAVPQSVFETRFLRLLRRERLPRPELQHQVRSGKRLVAIVDFAYPGEKVAIEADGYSWHSGRAQWEKDLTRRNALTAMGWRVIHVTWTELERRPAEIIKSIQKILAERASPAEEI